MELAFLLLPRMFNLNKKQDWLDVGKRDRNCFMKGIWEIAKNIFFIKILTPF